MIHGKPLVAGIVPAPNLDAIALAGRAPPMLGDVRPVGHRTRERPRRVGEHEQRGDDRVHAVVERQDYCPQIALGFSSLFGVSK